jgi:hypothetical protein
MRHKEKALELIAKFQSISILKDFGGMDFDIAKACALIAIDEICDGIDWHEVKLELQKVKEINNN